jgi:nucleoside triphosphate pyrophosphatase
VISSASPLALGSASPRRRALLEQLGIPLLVAAAHVDERGNDGENPPQYLERVTREKFIRVAADVRLERASALLVADTIVVVDEEILGKPQNTAEAQAMLERLSGRAHEVMTRFALGPLQGGGAAAIVHAETVCTLVEFRPLSSLAIARYAATQEGLDKAGAYAIQGIGSFAVRRIEGSYPNVVGLPVCEVVAALELHGFLANFPS